MIPAYVLKHIGLPPPTSLPQPAPSLSPPPPPPPTSPLPLPPPPPLPSPSPMPQQLFSSWLSHHLIVCVAAHCCCLRHCPLSGWQHCHLRCRLLAVSLSVGCVVLGCGVTSLSVSRCNVVVCVVAHCLGGSIIVCIVIHCVHRHPLCALLFVVYIVVCHLR